MVSKIGPLWTAARNRHLIEEGAGGLPLAKKQYRSAGFILKKRALPGPAVLSLERSTPLFYGETGLFSVFGICRLDRGDHVEYPLWHPIKIGRVIFISRKVSNIFRTLLFPNLLSE